MSDPHLEDRRQSDGKFGPGTTSETDIDLDVGGNVEQFLDDMAERHGQAYADRRRADLDSLDTESQREFYIAAAREFDSGMGPDQVRLMTAAGYGPADIPLAREKMLLVGDGTIAGTIPPAENLRALDGTPVEMGRSRWTDGAIATADPERLRDVASGEKVTLDKIVDLTDSKRADDLRSGAAAGLSLSVIESGYSVESMVSIKKVAPKTDVVRLAAKGHDGASVKAYGITACQVYDRDDLVATGLPGKTVKSYASAGVAIEGWQTYADSELSGKEAKAMRRMTLSTDPKRHVQMAEMVPVARLEEWRGALSKPFDLEDVQHIRDCEQAGYTPGRLGEMMSADSGYARECNDKYGSALATFSSWAKAGITDDEARRFSRAGVRPSQFADVKASGQDPWEAGEANRKRYETASWNGRREWPYERP